MDKLVVAVGIAAVALAGVISFTGSEALAPRVGVADVDAGTTSDAEVQRLSSRVAVLESALAEEIMAREDLLFRLDALAGRLGEETEETESAGVEAAPANVDRPYRREAAFVERARRAAPPQQVERLVEAGLDSGLAQRMVDREMELRHEVMQRNFEQMGEQRDAGEQLPAMMRRSSGEVAQALRDEFGDAQYDSYLYASGQANRSQVYGVLPGGVAADAGMQVGDIISSYDGQRILARGDLLQAQLDGPVGEPVLVEVLRNEQTVQLYLPRGPLGVEIAHRARVQPAGLVPPG